MTQRHRAFHEGRIVLAAVDRAVGAGRRCLMSTVRPMGRALLAAGLLALACRPAAARYMEECSLFLLRDAPVWTFDYQSRAVVRQAGVIPKKRSVTAFATSQIGSKLWLHLVNGGVIDDAYLVKPNYCWNLPPLGKERWDWDWDKFEHG